MKLYRGWWYYRAPHGAPSSSAWVARQHGVSLNTNTEAGIKAMIDAKQSERQAGPTWRDNTADTLA